MHLLFHVPYGQGEADNRHYPYASGLLTNGNVDCDRHSGEPLINAGAHPTKCY